MSLKKLQQFFFDVMVKRLAPKKKGAILLCLRVGNEQTTTGSALHIVLRRLYKAIG